MAITGEADGTPMNLGVVIVYVCAGLTAVSQHSEPSKLELNRAWSAL
ncbi:MAG TPA: hypothetical protein VLA54_04185 [Acidimicrobiia bacterium]|nr:hypothetical protein [Acidimicrobiia bacterium]